ncbi:hypothetical protein Tco_1566602 [Tanacetum coccineum]
MKSKTIGYGFRHLIENGIIAMEVDEESDETPIKSLTNEELCDKLVKRVEKDMRVYACDIMDCILDIVMLRSLRLV